MVVESTVLLASLKSPNTENTKMNDLLTLQALCTLLMCDDPSNLTPDARESIEKYADKESREMGFDNWIDAYHWTPDSEANAEVSHGDSEKRS